MYNETDIDKLEIEIIRDRLQRLEDQEIDPDEFEKKPSEWVLCRAHLANLVIEDRKNVGMVPKLPILHIGRLVCQYTELIKRLDACWNEITQVQKSPAIRKLLDAASTRLGELRDALTEASFSEYHYIDGALIELKLLPYDIEIIPLAAFPKERDEQLRNLAKRLFAGERIYVPPKEDDEEEEESPEDGPREDEKKLKRPVIGGKPIDPRIEKIKVAVALIQLHERARQDRLYFSDEQAIYYMRKCTDPPKKIPKEIKEEKAIEIQRHWRGFITRKMLKRKEMLRKRLIGMTEPSWKSNELAALKTERDQRFKTLREQKVQEYINICNEEKERIVRIVAPGLMEDIGDEIRFWFRNWYDKAKTFDKYPDEEDGGTIIVIRGDTLTPQEFRIEQERLRKEKEKLKKNPELARKAKADAAKKKREERKKALKEKKRLKKEKKAALEAEKKKKVPDPYMFKESAACALIEEKDAAFDAEWTPEDEAALVKDEPVMSKITEEKCYENQLECRRVVDEMMRLEHEMLEEAHARDRSHGKKGRKPQKKKKKKKKGKKGKKDPTKNRTTEDLFQELYDNGVIRQYPARNINDYFGDYAFQNYELRLEDYDPLPGLGDVRRTIINACIIPLAGELIPKPRSVCIMGPKESGKHFLIDAICTAADAVMFDMSPPILAKIYKGKKKLKMLLHLVNKMSRILQPSVIYVDGAEKMYYKRVPKEEKQDDPKKLKSKYIKEIVKRITPEDRVMAISITNQPWNCAQAKLEKTYEKFILIPRTDYGTIYKYWMDLLMPYHGVDREFNVSALAHMTVGYPLPYIKETVETVLTIARILRLKFEPLQQQEFFEVMMYGSHPVPVEEKELEKFTSFITKRTKIGQTRDKIVCAAEEVRAEAEKKALAMAKLLAKRAAAKAEKEAKEAAAAARAAAKAAADEAAAIRQAEIDAKKAAERAEREQALLNKRNKVIVR